MALEYSNKEQRLYFQLDFKANKLFNYSSVEKEGYVEHTSDTGKVSYRLYVNRIIGYIEGGFFRENNFGGKYFVLLLRDGDERYAIQMDVTGGLANGFARVIPNLDLSQKIIFSTGVYKNPDTKKEYLNVYVNYAEELTDEGKPKVVSWDKDVIPAPKKMKSGSYNFSEVEDAVYSLLEELVEKLKDYQPVQNKESNNVSPKTQTETSTSESKENDKVDDEEEDDMDLPF